MTTQAYAQQSRAPVALRPLALTDAPQVRRWMGDPALIRLTVVVPGPEHGPLAPYTVGEADQYLHTLVMDPSRRSYAIELGGQHVGNVGIKEWRPGAHSAECFIEIGEEGARGRGVGESALRQLLTLAFNELSLDEVRLGVFAFNAPAIALYRKLGFVDSGRYGWHWADGGYHEINAMVLARARFRR